LNVRESIVTTAMEMFSEKGYRGTTTKEIAERAGCNEVTLFRHFGTKEALFEETVQRFTPPSILPKDLSDLVTGDIRVDLVTIGLKYMEAATEKLPYIRMSLIEMPRNPELARLIAFLPVRMSSNVYEYFLHMREDGKIAEADYGRLTEIFYNMLFQYVLSVYVFDSGVREEGDLEDYVKTCAGLIAEPIAI